MGFMVCLRVMAVKLSQNNLADYGKTVDKIILLYIKTINMEIQGQIVDIENRRIYPGQITVSQGRITAVEEIEKAPPHYIMPGFVDAHVHIESSMLVPSEFARMAVLHGTVATISDPHEIANVLGIEGVRFMIENAKEVPFKFHFGAPSCVPATAFETAGGIIDAAGIEQLMSEPEIFYLAEMMNYPGTIARDPEIMAKIASAHKHGKPVDGHAPGVRGEDLQRYIDAGIYTDHECFSSEEAMDKLSRGMKILIREGSAARNFDALAPLIGEHFRMMMFCSDDKHPDDLATGHINTLCARAIALGHDLFNVLTMACVNPVKHYTMKNGLLKTGDPADFIVVKDLETFAVLETFIDGRCVAKDGKSLIKPVRFDHPNNFNIEKKRPEDFQLTIKSGNVRVIEAREGQLVTGEQHLATRFHDGLAHPDLSQDILKIAVVNRYFDAAPAVAFIRNFGLKRGAIASSVAHDSHNIIVVGVSDEQICQAVNLIIENRGGICAVDAGKQKILPLPVAGIISSLDGWETGKLYQEIDAMAKDMGSPLRAPFMTLSFMALLVIPDLKLSDRGLFSGAKFDFVDLET